MQTATAILGSGTHRRVVEFYFAATKKKSSLPGSEP
jgi:hypothetical protein